MTLYILLFCLLFAFAMIETFEINKRITERFCNKVIKNIINDLESDTIISNIFIAKIENNNINYIKKIKCKKYINTLEVCYKIMVNKELQSKLELLIASPNEDGIEISGIIKM